jgi:RHS repeat-associated protein
MRLLALLLIVSLSATGYAGQPAANATPGSEVWNSGAYAYDGAGNVVKIGTNTYRYDSARRLKEYLPEAGGAQTFSYDSFGNIKRIDFTPAGGGTISRVIPIDAASNHVGSSAGALYDRAGNMLSYSGTTYKYDSQNAIVLQEGVGKRYAYVYGPNDERLGTVNLLNKQWVWTVRDEGSRVLREYTSAGGTTGAGAWKWSRDYVYRNGKLLASESSEGTRHYHVDHLGSPRLVTDANAVKTAFHTYMPFGEEETSILQDRERARFTGHERDFAGGIVSENKDYLDYMHARYYNPMLGRFLSADPQIDTAKNIAAPQRWNRYAYVLNSPVSFVDLDGRDLVIVYDFSGSGLTWRQQSEVMQGVRRRFVNAGVRNVSSVIAGGNYKPKEEVKTDQVSYISYTRGMINKNRDAQGRTPWLSNSGVVSLYPALAAKLTPAEMMNYLINVTAHEVGHASTRLDHHDADLGKPVPGSIMYQMPPKDRAAMPREFDQYDSQVLQKELNP